MKAFPYKSLSGESWDSGMDLRDYFASRSMQAILTGSAWNISTPYQVAKKSYEYADAMMKERLNESHD